MNEENNLKTNEKAMTESVMEENTSEVICADNMYVHLNKDDKKRIRKEFNIMGLVMFVYDILFWLAVNIGDFFYTFVIMILYPSMSQDEVFGMLFSSGITTIIASIVAVAVPYALYRQKPKFEKHKKIGIKGIIVGFAFITVIQLVGNYILGIAGAFLYDFGYGMEEAAAIASDPSVMLSSLLYAVIFAPLSEEIMFRGLILHKLEKHGKNFAIVVSALLFALIHKNIVQFPITFMIGILFGYIALEYSLGAAVLLHLINNLFVEVMANLIMLTDTAYIADMIISFASLAIFVIVAFKKLWRKKFDNPDSPVEKGVSGVFLTSPVMIIFILLCLISTFTSVNPI